MFDNKIYCVLNSRTKFFLGAVIYVCLLNKVLYGLPLDWVFWMAIIHAFAGLIVVALQERPIGFGLLNIACELLSMVVIASCSIIPVMMAMISGLIPWSVLGITQTQMDGIGFVFVAGIYILFIVTLPALLLYLIFRWAIMSLYSDEPSMN